ncbi:hypothetical protein RIF29_39630 [Crotalaria pallida]|uniref:Uncharacterized protein n=1 Tax=Crotalaria pallida TaxID=3830 RepID=A0AAN9HTH6_CROPI
MLCLLCVQGDVTLKDEVCQMLGYVRCKKWSVIDAVGNTHEIMIQQLRAGGKLAITDGLDNIMDITNNIQTRFYIQYANVSGAAVLPLPESFVAAALPLSFGEHYIVDEDNVEHPVELGKREQVDVKKKTDLAFFRIRYEALRH